MVAQQLKSLRSRRGALVVVDVQRSFGDPAFLGASRLNAEAHESVARVIEVLGALVDRARALEVPVAWVELGSDPARPWRASNWLRGRDLDAAMADEEPCVIGTPGAEWIGMRPRAGEIRVTKRVYSGFNGTDLDRQLRAAGVEWIAVTGLTSECCVAATATDAFQLDYPVVVPHDGTAAYDVRIHEQVLEQLALNVAHITSVDDLVAEWETTAADEGAA